MQIIQFITDSENVSKAEKLDQRLQFGKQIKMTQPNWYHSIFQTVQNLLLIKQIVVWKLFTKNLQSVSCKIPSLKVSLYHKFKQYFSILAKLVQHGLSPLYEIWHD